VTGGAKLASGKRGRTERLLRLEVNRRCKSARTDQVFFIAFTRSGAIDGKLSDLNARGGPTTGRSGAAS
jgi:hypothetical protein